ncbi:MAG: exodeoxyribonuclease VII large subunit, partial [Solirubrobacterales bacterium]
MSDEPLPGLDGPAAGQDSGLPGPFAVGRYAGELRARLRQFEAISLIGEVTNHGSGRGGHVYFELRDADGAVPCAMWANDLARARLPEDSLADGARVVVGGSIDYYPGSATASPRLSFRAKTIRLAGEGDLLARLAELRRRLHAEGLFERQPALARPSVPRAIGVVTAEAGAARRDLVAGLQRRGWEGTLVWGFAPVQDRHAAPAIARALTDLAARPEVEVIVVCRGGGSLSDLWAFCDEALCRTVALLGTPVISAVGHETDRTLIDDVAAQACSTPTHAAEAAVPVDCTRARADLHRG